MSDICSICGLPKDICACDVVAKETQTVMIRMVRRRYGKPTTLVEGLDSKAVDLKGLAKQLKAKLACGGTVKSNIIELQGNKVQEAKKALVALGFQENTIDTK